jgi:branched-chain amino acid transport system permease protein
VLSWANFGSQLFNGLALGALLALIASGLTIIYGTLGVLNLAHGAMFMLGGYAGYMAYQASGSFVAAVAAGTLALGVLGIVMERVVIRFFYHRPHEDQLLVTFGLAIVFVEAVRWYFSSDSKTVQTPALLQGITNMGFMFYPTYRLAVVGICAVALLVLFLVLYRTRLGMIVRAGIEDSVMVDSASTSTACSWWCSASAPWPRASPASSTRRSFRSRRRSASRSWCRPSSWW